MTSYIEKLKEENLTLRMENDRLIKQLADQKDITSQKDSHIVELNGKRIDR